MIIFEVMNYLITKWEKLVENLKSWHKVLMAGLQKAPPSSYFRVVRFVIGHHPEQIQLVLKIPLINTWVI